MNETKRVVEDLRRWGFDDDTLQMLSEKGWRPERVHDECQARIDAGLASEGTIRGVFENEMFPGLFGGNPAEGIDVFQEFGFYSVPDLTEAERKPPEFIVDNMIPCGMTFLSGAPKTRKSFLALQIAIAVARGEPFFGNPVHQCDVAYLDLEGSKSRISYRTEKMSQAIPKNVFITNMDTTKSKLADTLIEKMRMLHRQRPSIRLIIIDTYSRSRGTYKPKGANAYDADVALLEPVQRMALEENIAILFVHHDKKGAGMVDDSFERLSGTMGISGSADCVMNLISEGKRFDGKATLEYTPRDSKGGEMKLEFNPMTLEWMQSIEMPVDIKGNPVCMWIVEHAPDRHTVGDFHSYEEVYKGAYHVDSDRPGDKITEQVKAHSMELITEYNLAVQIGVKSHGSRGIRIVNLI